MGLYHKIGTVEIRIGMSCFRKSCSISFFPHISCGKMTMSMYVTWISFYNWHIPFFFNEPRCINILKKNLHVLGNVWNSQHFFFRREYKTTDRSNSWLCTLKWPGMLMTCFQFAWMWPQEPENIVVINTRTHEPQAFNTVWHAAWKCFYGIQIAIPCSLIVYLTYERPDIAWRWSWWACSVSHGIIQWHHDNSQTSFSA